MVEENKMKTKQGRRSRRRGRRWRRKRVQEEKLVEGQNLPAESVISPKDESTERTSSAAKILKGFGVNSELLLPNCFANPFTQQK
jgi:hypothetical protein